MASNKERYDKTNATRPAGVGKVKAFQRGRYTLELADGRILRNVGGFGYVKFPEGSFVTFNERNGNIMILQPAPYGF